jgi:hydroxymethylglutaryl-CoA lyase
MTEIPQAVAIREVGPRDGLQLEPSLASGQKLRLIEALVRTGLRQIEAAAFVSPSAMPTMADAEQIAGALAAWPAVEWSALVASPGGARRAVAAGMRRVEYVVSAADGHSLANVRRTTHEATEATAQVARIVHDAGGRCEVIIATAWDCPFDGVTPPERTVRVATRAVELGADELCLADTIGTSVPGRVLDLVGAVRAVLPATPLGAHFHNTRGTGTASAWAAVTAGVGRLDASIGGLGGCPFAPGATGNIATEELVYLLADSGIETGIDLDRCLDAARMAQELVGHPLDSNLLRADGRSRPARLSRTASRSSRLSNHTSATPS